MKIQANRLRKHWKRIFPTHNLTYGLSGDFAYGEPSFFTMARVCFVISSQLEVMQKPLSGMDIICDWGAGAGKWLLYAPQFFQHPEMKVVGIECENKIFSVLENNILEARRSGFPIRAGVLNDFSQTFISFCPARILFAYDGAYRAKHVLKTEASRIHMTIMRLAFCSPTVDVIVSTRTNMHVFGRYFECDIEKLSGSVWKCLLFVVVILKVALLQLMFGFECLS